jgi:hypothetical protein
MTVMEYIDFVQLNLQKAKYFATHLKPRLRLSNVFALITPILMM